MSETASQTAPAQENVQEQHNAELANMMALHGLSKPTETQTNVQSAEPTTATPDSTPTQEAVAEPTPFQFQTFTEKFGWQKPEDALAEIEQLRLLKENPPKAEIKFENETAEKLFKAFTGGKTEEVYSYLAEQRKLDSFVSAEVTKDNAADIVKLGMQLEHRDLTQQEIDFEFNRQYGIPKEPIQRGDEDTEDFEIRKSDWQQAVQEAEMRRTIAAKIAKPKLVAAKTNLELPKLDESVDEDYVQYKQSQELNQQATEKAAEAYKTFTPKTIETKLSFIDEANKVTLDSSFEPDAESFNVAKEHLTDINKFFNQFIKDGKADHTGLMKSIWWANNYEKGIQEAMKQAKTATILALIPPVEGNGLQRQTVTNTSEVNELDQMMKLHGYSPQR